MEYLVPFVYRDFYDVPRSLVIDYEGHVVLLWSPFLLDADDYAGWYDIYELPSTIALTGSWEALPGLATARVGRVDVRDVVFDETRRRYIDIRSVPLKV